MEQQKEQEHRLNEFQLRKMNKSHSISTSHPLTCRSTANSCHSLAIKKLPQLPNTSHDQPDSATLHCCSKSNIDIHNVHPLKNQGVSKNENSSNLWNSLKLFGGCRSQFL